MSEVTLRVIAVWLYGVEEYAESFENRGVLNW